MLRPFRAMSRSMEKGRGMTKGDLINREFLKTAIHNFFNGLNHTPTEEDIQRYIEVAPSVENKGDFDGMTNGEVIQVLFPNAVIRNDDSMLIKEVLFTNEMWNNPYQKGGEEE